ncbi:MAG: HEAT repeat domain-containing protein [Deltaproteobacteria bacterium]|nr:HEAT repeat domain-containing protein [Deltaproteobacteria bacterium]
MASDGPESLLKSALEKVVFFECRIDQLEADLAATSAERDRLKAELSQFAARELHLKQELTELQTRYLGARRELEEEQSRNTTLRAERERWLTTMAEATRIREAGEGPQGEMDLAGFIAELRAEVEALRSGQKLERAVLPVAPPQDAAQLAVGMAQEGRIGFTERDRKELVRTARFETRAEETVFAFSLRELSSPHGDGRARAAQRLGALKSREAAAALAAALNAESDASVKPALIEALAATGGEEALPLLSPHLRDRQVPVRLAALEAAVKLGGASCTREIDRALSDESPRVRRRAALLAGSFGPTAGAPLLAHASADSDASVRRVAALAQAAFGGELARKALLGAADDDDLSVRRAAWQALSRLFTEPLLSVADEPSVRRRREIRRLEATPLKPLTLAESKPLEAVAQAAFTPAPVVEEAVVEPEPAPVVDDAALTEQLLSEVASSLRGRTLAELNAIAPEAAVARAAATLLGEGRLVRRNQRFFLA